jgi:Flp pilus assembly protein TadD
VLAPQNPDAFYGLGAALAAAGQHREAEAEYRHVLALAPEHPEGTNNLGAALLAQGRAAEAADVFERALRLAPADLEVQRNLALAFHESGRDADAIRILSAALAAAPDDAALLNLMAWIRATSREAGVRDAGEAVRLAERASASADNADPQYLDTLAAAYAEHGRYGDAVRTARQALALVASDSSLAREVERRLALYEQARPYRHE